MVVAGYLPVGAELPGPAFPLCPPGRALGGDVAEGTGGPQRALARDVLADAPLPVIHRGGHLAQIPGQLEVAGLRHARGPGFTYSRCQVSGLLADAGIEHG